MADYGRCTSDEELRLEYLLDKERVAGLDKGERYELEQLIQGDICTI